GSLKALASQVSRLLFQRLESSLPEAGSGGGDELGIEDGSAKRVVVMGFVGPNAGRIRVAAVRALSTNKTTTLLENAEAEDAARTLGVDLSTSEGRTAVADELRADAFVEGRVRRAGRRKWVAQIE